MTFENFIPPRAKSVLEITGEVAADFEPSKKNFTAIQPACKYSVEKTLPKTKNKFDAIIFQSAAIGNLANVELVNLIKAAAKLLNPHGRLIFTLENIGYAENVMAILEGKPLKFKTTLSKVELEEAISGAGLNEFNPMNAARRVEVKREIATAAKIDMAVFMYIISATPEELPAKTSIQISIGEKLVCGARRVFEPLNFIATTPNLTNFFYESKQVYPILRAENFANRIFINQRISFETFTEGKIFFEKLSKVGYVYVEEIDDNPIIWQKSYERNGFINFVGVHGIQTSTEYLAERLRQFNPVVKVFDNQLNTILPLRNFKKQKDFPVRIFFGAVNRDRDFVEILPVLNQFAQEYGDKISFKIIANKELFEAVQSPYKTLIGDPNFYNAQFVAYEKYEQALQESDISLLPLLDNEFNRSKSDLKFIESAGNGAVVLASNVVYPKTVKDGENGLIFRDKAEFAQKLKFLIDNKEKRYDMATAAYNYVKNNRMLSQHYEERLDWYFELFAKLDELNAATQARIDKIAPRFKDEKPPQIPQPAGNTGEIIIPDIR